MLVSIVTPTTDASHYVEATVRSVPTNEDCAIEHIVVHDGSAAFTARLSQAFPWLRVLQGRGEGATPACAMAIAAASGDFIFQLNSDDRMVPGSIAALVRAASLRPEIEVWTGGTRIFKKEGSEDRTIRNLDDPSVTALTLQNVLDDLPLMTARFVHRSVYERLGPLNARFSTCSDREFAIRMVLSGVREAPLDVRVSELRMHEGSRSIRRPGRSVPPYLGEHLAIARSWMARQELPREIRKAFRDWHARESLRKLYYETRAGQLTNAIRTAASAFAEDVQWPWRARSAISMLRLRRRKAG